MNEVCNCPCHQNPCIMHIAPCCIKCDECGKNITYEAFKAHEKTCKAKKVVKLKQPTPPVEVAELPEEIVIAL